MKTSGKSLDDWLVDYAAGKPVPDAIVEQLKDTRNIPHRRYVKAYINRAQYELTPLESLFNQIRALTRRVEALENEKGEPTKTRPLARRRQVS